VSRGGACFYAGNRPILIEDAFAELFPMTLLESPVRFQRANPIFS